MKKLLLSLMIFQASLLSAQHIRFGVKGGGDISFLSASAPTGIYVRPGPGGYLGTFMELGKFDGSKEKFQVELVGSQRFIRNQFRSNEKLISTRTMSVTQVSIPVMFRYFTRPVFSFNVGGTLNCNMYGQSKTEMENTGQVSKMDLKATEHLEPFQMGLLAGINYYYYKGFFLDVRYQLMTTSTLKDIVKTEYKDYLHAVQVGVGFKFQHHSKW